MVSIRSGFALASTCRVGGRARARSPNQITTRKCLVRYQVFEEHVLSVMLSLIRPRSRERRPFLKWKCTQRDVHAHAIGVCANKPDGSKRKRARPLGGASFLSNASTNGSSSPNPVSKVRSTSWVSRGSPQLNRYAADETKCQPCCWQ